MISINTQEFQTRTQNWASESTNNLLSLFESSLNNRFIGFDFGQVTTELNSAEGIRLHMGKKDDEFSLLLEVKASASSQTTYYASETKILSSQSPEDSLTPQFTTEDNFSSFPKRIPFIARRALVKNWEAYSSSAEMAFYAPDSNRVEYYTVNQVTVEEMDEVFKTGALNNLEILFGINLNHEVVKQPFFTLVLKLAGASVASDYWKYYDYVGACPPNCPETV